MARYFVKATPRTERLQDLRSMLDSGEISRMQPFGHALDFSLRNARFKADEGNAVWEEEDYCSPPLAQEREAVLDRYFDSLSVERIEEGKGWERIRKFPSLWGTVEMS